MFVQARRPSGTFRPANHRQGRRRQPQEWQERGFGELIADAAKVAPPENPTLKDPKTSP